MKKQTPEKDKIKNQLYAESYYRLLNYVLLFPAISIFQMVRGKTAANIQHEKMPPLMKKTSNGHKDTNQKNSRLPSSDE